VCTLSLGSPSYAKGGSWLGDTEIQPYPDCLHARYFHVTPFKVWESALLTRYGDMLLHAAVPARAYEHIYAAELKIMLPQSWRKRMQHAWYAHELLRRLRDAGVRLPTGNYSSIEGVDEVVLKHQEKLVDVFVTHWGKGHHTVCRSPDRCNCYILDGHMKCRRITCANKLARVVDTGKGSLGELVLPCDNTPAYGSRWCAECFDAGAVRGTRGTDVVGMGVPDAPPQPPADPEVEDPPREHMDKDVYLVADLLGERPTTVKREGEAHRTCARKKEKAYLVDWVGYSAAEQSWVCGCNIGRAAKDGYKRKKEQEAVGRREAQKEKKQHAGERAASAREKALSTEGDPNLRADERAELAKENPCECLKDAHAAMKEQSAGVLALVASCGLILCYGEIFGSESLSQVHLFLFDVHFRHMLPVPEVLAYDDACHLGMFLTNRMGRFGYSLVAHLLLFVKKLELVCDRFHWRNHTGEWCKRNVNPKNSTKLGPKTNTEAAENTFVWLSKYKFIFKHMNKARFNFTMLWLFHERNQWLCAQCKACNE
jgi:hypothetical protein